MHQPKLHSQGYSHSLRFVCPLSPGWLLPFDTHRVKPRCLQWTASSLSQSPSLSLLSVLPRPACTTSPHATGSGPRPDSGKQRRGNNHHCLQDGVDYHPAWVRGSAPCLPDPGLHLGSPAKGPSIVVTRIPVSSGRSMARNKGHTVLAWPAAPLAPPQHPSESPDRCWMLLDAGVPR